MSFETTALYVGINALILVALGLNVVRWRWRLKAVHGDGGDEMMARAIRGHANAAEYMPIGLLIVAITEAAYANPVYANALGILLTLARLSHAYAFLGRRRRFFRMIGAGGTFVVLILGGIGLIVQALVG